MLKEISPAVISSFYFFFSLCWIIFSEIILINLGLEVGLKNKIEVVKGVFFIASTTLILYLLLKRWKSQIDSKNEDLHKVYKELEKSNERLRLAFDASQEGYWEHNLITNELIHSPSMYTMFGIDDLYMQNDYSWWSEHILPDDYLLLMDMLNKCEKGEIESYDFVFRIKPLGEKIFVTTHLPIIFTIRN